MQSPAFSQYNSLLVFVRITQNVDVCVRFVHNKLGVYVDSSVALLLLMLIINYARHVFTRRNVDCVCVCVRFTGHTCANVWTSAQHRYIYDYYLSEKIQK